MPQLETSTYITQIFWLITTFICFWGIMSKIIIPQIAEKVEDRKRKYNDFIIKAEEMNNKALNTLKQYDETMAVARAKATEQIAQNEQAMKALVEQKEQEINQQLKQKILENEKQLQKEKKATLKHIDSMAEKAVYSILTELEITSVSKQEIEQMSQKDSH